MKKLLLFVILTFAINAQSQLRIGIYNSPPFITSDSPDGASVDLWLYAMRDTFVKCEFVYYNDIPTGELLEKMESDNLDVVLGSTTITSSRLDKYNFSQPYWTSNLSIAKKKSNQVLKGVFATLVSGQFLILLLSLLVVVNFFGLLFWWREHKTNEDFRDAPLPGIFDGFYFAFVALTTVGLGDKKPITSSGKIIMIFWMLTSYIITAVFIGGMSATIFANIEKYNVNSIEDLRSTKVGTIVNTTGADFLDDNNVKYIGYASVEKALEDIENGNLETFVYDTPVLKYLIHENDYRIVLSDNTFDEQYYGIVFKEDSKLIKYINQKIFESKSDGTYDKIISSYNL